MKANACENKARIPHKRKVGDKVFVTHEKNSFVRPRKLSVPREGPWVIASAHDNGAHKINWKGAKEIMKNSRLRPNFERNNDIFMTGTNNKDNKKCKNSYDNKKLKEKKVKFDLAIETIEC